MKVAFLGTPQFAVPTLRALHESSEHEVVCVVTQPDKPSGRNKSIVMSPVKEYALEHGIKVFQPERISKALAEGVNPPAPDGAPPLRKGEELEKNICETLASCDVIVTCAFGQILRQNVIDYCKFGVINVHASILPKYRGACPVNMAIIHGETQTGITIMQTDIGIDTGDMYSFAEVDILQGETAGELLVRLAPIGAELLVKTLTDIENGNAKRTKQDDSKASYYPMLKKEHGRIDMSKTPREIVNFVRGMHPWPCAFAESNYGDIKIHKASASKEGNVQFDLVQAPGSRVMTWKEFVNGRKDIEFK